MTLFQNDGKSALPKGGLYDVKIRRVWFFWLWIVTYSGSDLYDRMGVTRSRSKAIQKASDTVKSIMRNTGEEDHTDAAT